MAYPIRKALLLLIAVWVCSAITPPQAVAAHHNRHVLVLHSYHFELPWSQGLMAGLHKALATTDMPIVLHVEYLDNIRHRQEVIFPIFKRFLKEKYESVILDAIVVTDDVALNFLLMHREALFPGIPLIFCGPNDFKPARLTGYRDITGIAENPDFRGTVELILKLYPQVHRIALVSDRNPASLRVIEGLRRLEHEMAGRFKLELLTHASLDALQVELQALPPGSPVLFHAFLRDADGRTYPSNLEVLRTLTAAVPLPFYAFKKIDIGHGAIGGAVISEELMADIAGQMVIRILNGEKPDDIPVIYNTPHIYLFDYLQLERFGIRIDALPEGSHFINRPFSLYHQHKTAILTAATTFLILLLLLLFMTFKSRSSTRERQRAEVALQESRLLLETAVAQSPSGILIAEAPDVTIRMANPAALGIRGADSEILTNINVSRHATRWQTFYPDGTPYPPEQLPLSRAILQGEVTQNEEVIIRHQDGQDHWVSASAAPVRDARRQITAGIVIFHDITDRKQAEWALQESEARYHVLFEESPDAYLILDDGIFVGCNRAAEKILASPRDQIVGCHPTEFSPEYQSDGTRSEQAAAEKIQLALDQAPQTFEWLHQRRNGEVFWAEVSLAKMIMSQKTVLIASVRDISTRKQAEEALRHSEAKLKNLFDTMPNGYYLSTAAGCFVDANPAFVKMLEYDSLEELKQVDIPKELYVSEADRDHYLKNPANTEFLESSHVESYCLKTKNGRIIHVEDNARYITDEQGRIHYHEGICRDVTLQKQAEAERAKLQEQLLQAQKMESVGILAGGVAHDFNNMLQAIGGYTELMLLNKSANDPDYPRLEALKRTTIRAAELVRQLLLFSRKAGSQRQPLNVNVEVQEAARILKRTIPRMITIEPHLDSKLWRIDADPVQLQQVLLNLGSNAADAMPEGGHLIFETSNQILDEQFARTHVECIPGNYVLLSVSDTGQGMDAETRAHIFEPFYTTKEIGKGTGLGLASAYGIVKAHDGHILCYSERDQGTTFKIYLPALINGNDTEVDNTLIESPLTGGTETILVVDDEADILSVVTETLIRFGYQTLTAANGEEALEMYRRNAQAIDLVILDIGMPGMGGRRCLEELLKLSPALPILIASGYANLGQTWQDMTPRAAGFIGKPYQLSDLLWRVREALDTERGVTS